MSATRIHPGDSAEAGSAVAVPVRWKFPFACLAATAVSAFFAVTAKGRTAIDLNPSGGNRIAVVDARAQIVCAVLAALSAAGSAPCRPEPSGPRSSSACSSGTGETRREG